MFRFINKEDYTIVHHYSTIPFYLIRVESSIIKAMKMYSEGRKTRLFVCFNNNEIFEYRNVTADFYSALMRAQKVGKLFQVIKKDQEKYPCKKIGKFAENGEFTPVT